MLALMLEPQGNERLRLMCSRYTAVGVWMCGGGLSWAGHASTAEGGRLGLRAAGALRQVRGQTPG